MSDQTTFQGLCYVISAPSGTGKTTLVKSLLESIDSLALCVSHTTRTRRENEKEGLHYHFTDQETFQAMKDSGQFIESAKVFGNYYGTSYQEIESKCQQGLDLILEIDCQGAGQVIEKLKGKARSIFILPPSLAENRRRLENRGTDQPSVIETRLEGAITEIQTFHRYDYIVINDDFDRAMTDLRSIVRAERSKNIPNRFDSRVSKLLAERS